jgi:tetraacyldisaccharide 4'-kinase
MKAPTRALGRRPRLERYWRAGLPLRDRLLWSAMVPPALLYEAATALHAAWFRIPGLRRKAAATRVISVGNLTVGGNAKTPFALYLARKLAEREIRTAIVSRGYGGSLGSGAPMLVSDGGTLRMSVEEAGDEAVMMARVFEGPVAIARRRLDAIAMLQRLGPLDAVVLDDAFQHLRLARDLNLLLVSAERGFGNGWMLPAGPMRERLGAAGRADAVVVLSPKPGLQPDLSRAQAARLRKIPMLRGLIEPRALVYPESGRWREAAAQSLGGRRILAVSALADPRSFYAMLRELEADLVGVLEYPDHYQYSAADWQSIWRAAATVDLVVTTEKDLVKLERFPFPRNSIAALRLEIAMGADEEKLLLMALGVDRLTPRAGAAAKGGASSGA